MEEVKLIIELPENKYNAIMTMYDTFPAEWKKWGLEAIKNGTKMPKIESNIKRKFIEIKYLPVGSVVEFGGIQWEILDQHFPALAGTPALTGTGCEGVFCLAKDIVNYKAFDENKCNDWRTSTLRDYLNGDFKNTLAASMYENFILPFERDLTSDDGLKDYEKCIDYVSLISYDEYRKYRYCISNKLNAWWTITPWSTSSSGRSYNARYIFNDGLLSSKSVYCEGYGVVPCLCVREFLTVKVIKIKEENKNESV